MSHIFIFIYCYGFYFNLIGYIKFRFLIGFNFNFLRLQIEMQYHSFTRIWFRVVFLFHPFKESFFSLQGQWPFVFSIKMIDLLSPTSVTTHSDRCYRQQFNPKPSYFQHLAGGRVAEVHEEASLNDNAKRTAIHHRSLVPRGRFATGSVPQMLRYIYAPPQNLSRSGDAKQILPLTGDDVALARTHARVIPNWGMGVGFCLLNTYAATRGQ